MTGVLPSRLYVICDADVCARSGWRLPDFAAACLDGGARLLQIRAKHASARALLEASDQILRRAESAGATVIVNDRADVAAIAGAHGVHVGQEDLSPVDVRRLVGSAAIAGLSTHTVAQIAAALVEPISYVAIGPVFGTATKDTGYDAVGLPLVREAAARAQAAGLPVVAIGGITLQNASSVLEAGAAAVAVISDLASADPRKTTRAYVDRLDAASR